MVNKRNFKKNKKAYVFALLILIVVLISGVTFILTFTNLDEIKKTNFGDSTKTISTIKSQKISDKIYFDLEVENILKEIKKNVVLKLQDGSSNGDVDVDTLNTCNLRGLDIWYNEKNINLNNLNNKDLDVSKKKLKKIIKKILLIKMKLIHKRMN